MLLISHEVAYCSSVVMFRMVPALRGMSASPVVLPVRISGPLVSRAMATWRPFWAFSAARALSMTDSGTPALAIRSYTRAKSRQSDLGGPCLVEQ